MAQFVDELILNIQSEDKIAIVQDERQLSYSQLRNAVYDLSTEILKYKSHDNFRVYIFLEKSIEAIISVLGVMVSGGTYIPLDCSLPERRLYAIMSNCRGSLLITDKKGVQAIDGITKQLAIQTLVINDIAQEHDINQGRMNNLAKLESSATQNRSPRDIAYIIYTSGSTGEPKGVMIKHESLYSFIQSLIEFEGSGQMRYLSIAPLHYDVSIMDIFFTLCSGGTLFLMGNFLLPNKITQMLFKHHITHSFMTATVMKLFSSKYAEINKYQLSDLKMIWFGGEACSINHIRIVHEAYPWVTLINAYGPTETACMSHMYPIQEKDFIENKTGFFPFGKELPTVESYAINEKNAVIKPGEIGELCIGGIQVMAGYCNDPIKTGQVIKPSIIDAKKRAYKTGDYVTIDDKGNYYFVGRNDGMFKVSGNLVYLSEIEKLLLAHESILDAIVIAIEGKTGMTNTLKGYIVPKEGELLSLEQINKYIRIHLPEYMSLGSIEIVSTENLPRNSSGKLNKKELLA